MTTKLLPIADLRTDGGTQLRVRIDEHHVEDLSQVYGEDESADKIPSIEVLFDSTDYWVWDGNHRILGAQKAGRDKIKCHVEKGTQRDAILKAAGANDSHGLKRSNQDKRKAVAALLADKEWARRSDRWIAATCRVDGQTVASVKEATAFQLRKSAVETVECQDGKKRPARRKRRTPNLPYPNSFEHPTSTSGDPARVSSGQATDAAGAVSEPDAGGEFRQRLVEFCKAQIDNIDGLNWQLIGAVLLSVGDDCPGWN